MMENAGGFNTATLARLAVVFYLTCLNGQSYCLTVNVALNKPVTAYYSCGQFGKETYTTMSDAYSSASSRSSKSCVDIQDVAVKPSYPPEALVDGLPDTWWQSTSRTRTFYYGKELTPEMSRELEAMIEIDLNQEFLMEQLVMQLGDALSPQKISILKSLDNITFTPWINAVTSENWCLSFFNMSLKPKPENSADVICIVYLVDDKPPGDTVTIDLTTVAASLKEWTRVRYLKIKFYDMMFVYPFNSLADTYNHYAVTEITAKAECPCNGLQIGCEISNITKMYECICGGNTRGRFCESCLPLFNQFAFQNGKPCVECNCFGHSLSCFYKASVEQDRLSLDKNGTKNGGGVCFNCKNFTAGINCQKCVDLYYRPLNRLQTAENACIPCLCNSLGSTVNPNTNLVDCVMNNDSALPDNKKPGDCFCKTNVEGSKCDSCKSGFYNLQQNNSLGCSSCDCDTLGTLNSSTTCMPDDVGQCSCKTNVGGRTCDTCKDGFYNLTKDNPDGCTPCNCDKGGSVSQTCNKLTGQCVCISQNIFGNSCDSIQSGYYYPSPHSIYTELEDSVGKVVINRNYLGFSGKGYAVVNTGSSLIFVLTTPKNTDLGSDYIPIVVYHSQFTCNITVAVRSEDDQVVTRNLILQACNTSWCQMINSTSETINLYPGPNLVSIQINSGSAFLDKLIALPVKLTNITQLLASPLPVGCDIMTNQIPVDQVNKTLCQKAIFTVTMFYWNAPLSCSCDVTGSVSMYCNANGGQCQCHAGVTGRTCNKCLPDYFAFNSTGCSACNCTGSNSSCDSVTGQCLCPYNTIGRHCEFCVPNNWNWSKNDGCQDCGCSPVGSLSLQCNLTTGVCQCKAGFQGNKCDLCLTEYYLTENNDCSPCLCNQNGALSSVCNVTSGQCPCKENTVGRQCDMCNVSSYALGSSASLGCLECVCMGITSNCTSAGVKLRYDLYNLINKTDGITSTLQLVDENVTIYQLHVQLGTDPNYIGEVVVDVTTSQPMLYWRLPDSFTSSLLSVYGSSVKFTLKYISTSYTPSVPLKAILVYGKGDKMIYSVGNISEGNDTDFMVILQEDGWKKQKNDALPIRGEFLKALFEAKALLIPASFGAGNHTVQLSKLSLGYLSDVGLLNSAVEQCECGQGYVGRSCEMCAPGYRRVNVNTSDYLGNCVPCDCHGHSFNCDSNTGDCLNCNHNTSGTSCEICKTGYYGDPLYGCSECPCYQPRVINETCHFVNSSDGLSTVSVCSFCKPGYIGDLCDKCDSMYYGEPTKVNGSCLPCQCNGNAFSCNNITGVCESCSNNTIGDHCQHCAQGFYGNASLHNCQECRCKASNSTICDSLTGQCSCLPDVEGRDCSFCTAGFWGFNNVTGCQSCQCVQPGSSIILCNNDTGQCSCKANTSGKTCDTCFDGFYGLPRNACQACSCNSTGTVRDTLCNKISGQCQCLPGVGGLNCDKCLPLYVNFSSSGCEACGHCQRSLGQDIDNLTQSAEKLLTKTKSILDVQREGTRLDNLSIKLNRSLVLLGIANTNATSVQDIITEVSDSKNLSVSKLQQSSNNINQLVQAANQTKLNSEAIQNTIDNMKNLSTCLLTLANSFEVELIQHLQYLKQLNLTASQYLNESSRSTMLSFALEMNTATNLIHMVNDSLPIINSINALISQQADTIGRLDELVMELNNQLDTKSGNETNLTAVLDSLSFTTYNVDYIQSQSEMYRSQAEHLYQSFNEILTSTSTTNADILSNLTSATSSVRNIDSIYDGNGSSVMSAYDYPPFPAGVNNYMKGFITLQKLLSTTPELIANVSQLVNSSEAHVAELNGTLTLFSNSYQNITNIGKEAVMAVTTLDTVIRDLNQSLDMMSSAQKLIQDVQSNLTGTNFDQTALTYGAEKNASEDSANKMLQISVNYQPQVLKSSLDSALLNLDKEGTHWTIADEAIVNMTSKADSLSSQSKDKHVTDDLNSAIARLQAVVSLVQTTNLRFDEHDSLLIQKKSELDILEMQINQVQNLQKYIQQSLANQQGKFENLMGNLTNATNLNGNMDQSIKSVEDKIKLLETKMVNAESLLSKLRIPLTFDGNLSLQVQNPEQGIPHLYDNVLIDVKKHGNFSDGVVLLIGNSGTDAEFQIGFTNGSIFLRFNNGNEALKLVNEANICSDCWVRVFASRYANVGHLSVVSLASGATVSNSVVGADPNAKTINLNSDIYVGSLPIDTDKVTNKVAAVNRQFRGCLFNAMYQGQYLNLWTKTTSTASQVKCCEMPPSVANPAINPGLSFAGFGFIELLPGNINFSDISQLSFEFRTFSSNAVLFSVKSSDLSNSFTFSLVSGYIQWTIWNKIAKHNLSTTNQYNNGQWFQMLAIVSATEMKLSLRNLADQSSLEVKNLSVNGLDLSLFNGNNFIFGSNINKTVSGYGDLGFSGCIRNATLTTSQNITLLFTSSVASSADVITTGCYSNIKNGISFSSQLAYARFLISDSSFQLQKLELNIITNDVNGILLYISNNNGMRFFYMALFGGNVIVVYRQNNTATVVSSGHYISDGQLHTVVVNCNTYRVSVRVDGTTFEEATQTLTTNYLSFLSKPLLYLGGQPSLSLQPECPVNDSLVGGISRLVINDGTINLMATVSHLDVSYAGIPATVIVTAAAMTICASTPTPSYLQYSEGFVMTSQYDILLNQLIQVSNLMEYLNNEFIIHIELAIYKADGVLLYVADLPRSPKSYFTIFFIDGNIHVQLRTSTETDLKASLSKSLTDGKRVKISIYRKNDYVAIYNDQDKDYDNSKANSNITSRFNISNTNNIYFGSLSDNDVGTSPLPDAFHTQQNKVRFAGAIYSLTIERSITDNATLKLDSLNRTQFPAIATKSYYGISLSSINSYLGLGNITTLGSFQMSISFTTTSRSGLIFLLYVSSSSYFVALDYNNNKIQFYIAPSFQGTTENVIIIMDTSTNICDGLKHDLSLQIDTSTVKLSIDNVMKSTQTIPASNMVQPMTDAQFFVGGLKDPTLSWLPQGLSKASLSACVLSVTYNGTVHYDPTQYGSTSAGITYSCPY